MTSSPPFKPEFGKVNLLALYATMYLKRIVVNKLPWKEHLNILFEEVKGNMEKLGKEKEIYLFATLRDFARMYGNQWAMKEYEQEVGKPAFHTMLIVLVLRLGIDRLWIPDYPYFREDILVEGFLAKKPKLKLTYLSQGDPLYDNMVILCPNLYHVSMPFADNALFMKTVTIKTLRVLEFSTGVADKVLCYSLWNIDKKSDKVLQIAVKDKKEGNYSLALPHLEILRSNIQMNRNGASSMKVTLGAAALALQPKLKIVENRRFWSTFQAVQALLEMESKFKLKHQKRLAVDRLLFTKQHLQSDDMNEQIPKVLESCPAVSGIVITECYSKIPSSLLTTLKLKMSILKNLSLDVTSVSEQEFWTLLVSLGNNLKNLTLRLNLKFIDKFHLLYIQKKIASERLRIPLSIETLSLILMDKNEKLECDEVSCKPAAIMDFLICFSHIHTLNYYNMHWVPPLLTVFGCIGGALAVMEKLQHLSIRGGSVLSFIDITKILKDNLDVRNIIPELIDDSTFKVLRNLTSFSLDEVFVNDRVDSFLDLLRMCDVHVKINYRPQSRKGVDLAKFLDCNDFDDLYSTCDDPDGWDCII